MSSAEESRTFYRIALPFGEVGVRDVQESDIPEFVRYWHFSGDEHLRNLNIDRSELGTPEATTSRFRTWIRTGDPDQLAIAFAITLDDEVKGYFNLNRYSPVDNYPHFHITAQEHRALGGATACMPYGLKMFFDLFLIERVILQTRTRVVGINKLLDKFLPIAETAYLENPDGLAGPGEFHHRYIYRKDIPSFVAQCDAFRAQLLNESGQASARTG